MQQRQLVHVVGEAVGERHDDRENHGGGADHGRADQHGLRRGFERVASAVVFFEQVLGALEVHVDVEIRLQFLLDVRNLLDQRKLVDGLRVVGHRPVGIHGDGHRAHAQESKRHQAEREHRRGNHQVAEALLS